MPAAWARSSVRRASGIDLVCCMRCANTAAKGLSAAGEEIKSLICLMVACKMEAWRDHVSSRPGGGPLRDDFLHAG